MKSLSICAALVALSSSAYATSYRFDARASTITWTGSKQFVESAHTGTVALKEGELTLDEKTGGKGRLVIDMESIANADVQDPQWRGKLESHLKSADFFDVAKFKETVLVVKELKPDPKEKGRYLAKADLTMRGKTAEVSFPAQVTVTGGAVEVKSQLVLDRTKWGVAYGSPASFDIKDVSKVVEDKIKSVKDKVIKNEFTIEVKLVGSEPKRS